MVFGIEAPGEEFMESVFQLEVNQAGTAVNAPHSIVYVVRVVRETPDEDTRRERFIETGVGMDTYYMAIMDSQKRLFDWFKQLETDYKVDWQRPPVGEPDML